MKLCIASILLCVAMSNSHAEIVNWQVTGHVTNALATPPGQGGQINGPGQFQITLTFDDSVIDGNPSTTSGSFGNLLAVNILLDGQDFHEAYGGSADSFVPNAQSAILIQNDVLTNGVFTDSLRVSAADIRTWDGNPPWGTTPFNYFLLELVHSSDTPSSALTSDAIPGRLPDLQQFEVRRMEVGGIYDATDLYWYEISVDSLKAVPIPAAGWLLLSSGGVLSIARRRARGNKPLALNPPA